MKNKLLDRVNNITKKVYEARYGKRELKTMGQELEDWLKIIDKLR